MFVVPQVTKGDQVIVLPQPQAPVALLIVRIEHETRHTALLCMN